MGNAKFINKLLAQTKQDAKTIEAQRKQIEANETTLITRVQAAVDTLAQAHADELAKLRADHAREIGTEAKRHNEDWQAAAERQDVQMRKLCEATNKANNLERDLASARQEIDNLTLINKHQEGRILELETQLATIKPELELLETKKQELTQLCDKVRDRMKRKERDEESAILNRKAVTLMAPGFLRRR